MDAPPLAVPVALRGRLVTPDRSLRRPSLPRRVGLALSSVLAAVMGLLPHILHHAGPLAGAALFAGLGGSLLFGALGLVAAVPFLLRVRRRHGSWRLPAALLALFAAVFSVSTFAIGPAISGGSDAADRRAVPASRAPGQPRPADHEEHHR